MLKLKFSHELNFVFLLNEKRTIVLECTNIHRTWIFFFLVGGDLFKMGELIQESDI